MLNRWSKLELFLLVFGFISAVNILPALAEEKPVMNTSKEVAVSTQPAQPADKPAALNTGQDFTRPLTRLDIRQKYDALPGGNESYAATLRIDKPIVLNKARWIICLRVDLPRVENNVPTANNPNSEYDSGESDFLTGATIIAPQGKKNWTYGFGARIIWPTATKPQLGGGRYQIAPNFGVKMDLKGISRGSFVSLILNDNIDAGGVSSRPPINYFSFTPCINIALPGRSFVTVAPDIRIDWMNNNAWFVPFDITLGKMLNRTTVVSLEFKTPVYNYDYPMYNDELEARVGFFFR